MPNQSGVIDVECIVLKQESLPLFQLSFMSHATYTTYINLSPV